MKLRTAASAFLVAANLGGNAIADENLAKSKACLSCHAVDRKLVGPSYKDISAKYRADNDAEARLARKVREGSAGAWGGPLTMPPNPAVSEAEARTLAKWILGMK